MLLKDFIKKLQELYDSEVSEEYLEVMGEPEIMIDTFEKVDTLFRYRGFSKDISVTRSDDGVYMILNRFKV